MTYPKALDALVGHLDWWHYEYHGRTDPKVQAKAIELAHTWVRPDLPNIDEHLREAASLPVRAKPCGC
jgi:hypothetical protein